jgi:hypothetical protein
MAVAFVLLFASVAFTLTVPGYQRRTGVASVSTKNRLGGAVAVVCWKNGRIGGRAVLR